MTVWVDYGDGYVESMYYKDVGTLQPHNHTYPAVVALYHLFIVVTNLECVKYP